MATPPGGVRTFTEMMHGSFSAVTHGNVHSFFVYARISMKLSWIAYTGALRILSIYGLYLVTYFMAVVSYKSARMRFCATVIRKR